MYRLTSATPIGMRTGFARRRRSHETRSSKTRRRSAAGQRRRFAVCIDNDGFEASLERNKIYVVIVDDNAGKDGDIRVIDESGEDYLFSAERFVAIDVPPRVKKSLQQVFRIRT